MRFALGMLCTSHDSFGSFPWTTGPGFVGIPRILPLPSERQSCKRSYLRLRKVVLHLCAARSQPFAITASPTAIAMNPLKNFLQNAKPQNNVPTHIVLGNEAADLDSLSCAIALAYTWRHDKRYTTVPVANIPRDELRLRRDAILALSLADISPDDLVFIDDLPRGLETAVASGALTLVDHNVLTSRQQLASSRVVAVVDHHKDEQAHLSANPRIIRYVASCATLVTGMLESGTDRNVARLLLCALLLDTNSLRAVDKTTNMDRSAFARLLKWSEWNRMQVSDIHTQLKKSRQDLSEFDARDLLLRDLKLYSAGGLSVAIASIGLSPENLTKLAKERKLAKCLEQFQHEKGVDCVLSLLSHSVRGDRQRHLAVSTGRVGDLLQRQLFSNGNGGVALERAEIEGEPGIWWFRLKDSSTSRKLVAPYVSYSLGIVAKMLD